jgi:hypothetical protein
MSRLNLRFPRKSMFKEDFRIFIKDFFTIPLQIVCLIFGHGNKKIEGTDFEICLYCGRLKNLRKVRHEH